VRRCSSNSTRFLNNRHSLNTLAMVCSAMRQAIPYLTETSETTETKVKHRFYLSILEPLAVTKFPLLTASFKIS
jgi:hypothetical protein